MGTPTTPDPFGADCISCFAAGTTPAIAYVKFTGMTACPGAPMPAPNGVKFTLTQNPLDPCKWFMYSAGWNVFWDPTATTGLVIDLWYFGRTVSYFCAYGPQPCEIDFENYNTSCPGPDAIGGFAHVWFETDPIPEIICETMGFHPGLANLYHVTPTIDNMADYRIANPKDKTNILIRINMLLAQSPPALIFSGTLSPDATGLYEITGIVSEQPYYHTQILNFFLWFDGESWYVSKLLEDPGDYGWNGSAMIGLFYPYGACSGIGTMQLPS